MYSKESSFQGGVRAKFLCPRMTAARLRHTSEVAPLTEILRPGRSTGTEQFAVIARSLPVRAFGRFRIHANVLWKISPSNLLKTLLLEIGVRYERKLALTSIT